MADAPQQWTIAQLLNWTKDYLGQRGIDQPRLCAELLLAHVLHCEKIQLYTRFQESPNPDQLAALRELLRKAGQRAPVAYLTGGKEFFSLSFEVTPAVLIPRPETELLVEEVISFCRPHDRQDWNILDVGTGSGCIAVALAKYIPTARFVASDISPEALQVAQRNVERHDLQERIRLVRADALKLPGEVLPNGGFDIIVSNPPYVADNQVHLLPAEVAQYEPRVALVGGPQGLAFYQLLAEQAPPLLWPGAGLFAEVGYGQHEQVQQIFAATRRFELVKLRRDLAGVERVMHFRLTG